MNTYSVSSTEDHTYVVINEDGIVAIGTATNLTDNEVRNINVDLTSYRTLTISTGVSNLGTFKFKIAGRLFDAAETSSGNYSIKLSDSVPSGTEIQYYIVDDNYAPYCSSIIYTGSNQTENITLNSCTKSSFTRPDLTANGTLNGSSFAVSARTISDNPAWKAMDSSTSTYWQSESLNEGNVSPTTKYADYIIYNPNFFLIGSITLTAQSTSYCPSDINVYTSIDGINWELDQKISANTSASVTITMNAILPYKYVKLNMNARYYYYPNINITNITFASTYEWVVSDTYSLTVNTTPSDAVVLFNSSNASGKTTQVGYGGAVEYTVAKAGYEPISGTVSTLNTNKTINVTLTNQATPNMTWYAWKNKNTIIYTQTEKPIAFSDWTFSAPNNIANIITAVSVSTVISNNITYIKAPELNITGHLSTQVFTIQTDASTSNNKEFYLPIETNTPYVLTINWGDGNTELVQGIGTYPHHTYTTKGTYQVSITSELGKMPRLLGSLFNNTTYKYPNRQIKSMDSIILPMYQNYLEDFNDFTKDQLFYITYYADKMSNVCSNVLEKSNLINYINIFYQCSYLTSIPKIDLNNIENIIGDYKYQKTFFGCTRMSGTIDLSSLTTISGLYAMSSTFFGCTSLTSVDLSNLTTINNYGLYETFYGCTSLTSVDLSSLTTVSSTSGITDTFQNCTSLTSVDLSSLTTISGSGAMNSAFNGCTSLTSVDLSSLTTISGSQGMYCAFSGCTSLTSVDLSSLTTISGSQAMSYSFNGCTSLRTISFPSLATNSFGSYTNQFNNMLSGCSNVTVHFPADIKNTIRNWDGVKSGFGGTNTTVLFDIGGCEVTFDCTPSTNNQIMLDHLVLSGNISWEPKGAEEIYHVYNTNSHKLYIGQVTIPNSNSTTISVDTTQATTAVIVDAGISGLAVTYTIHGETYTPQDLGDGKYRLYIYAPSGVSIAYDINGGESYMDVSGAIQYNGGSTDVTETVTMTPATIATFTQPVLTSNGTLGGSSFAVSSNLAGTNTWKLFDGSNTNLTYYSSSPVNMSIVIYNPSPIKLTSYETYWMQASVAYQAHTGQIYGSNNGITWTKINEFTRSNYTQTTTTTVNSPDFYKYYKIEEQPDSSWWWGANEITLTATKKVAASAGE